MGGYIFDICIVKFIVGILLYLYVIVLGKENRGWLYGSYWCVWFLDCDCGGLIFVGSGFLYVEFFEKKINRG